MKLSLSLSEILYDDYSLVQLDNPHVRYISIDITTPIPSSPTTTPEPTEPPVNPSLTIYVLASAIIGVIVLAIIAFGKDRNRS